MTPFRYFVRAAVTMAACLAMAGCISVLPKSKPSQLYRFGAADPAADAARAPGGPSIAKGPVTFDSSAATDRILTVTGDDIAYIAGARWVSPAPVLFDEALIRAFQAVPGAPRLIERAGAGRAPLVLTLDVQAFETRYDQGADAAPQVTIRIHAVLVRTEDRTVAADKLFAVTKRVSDNRVGPIVSGYDEAVAEVLSQIVTWASAVPQAA